MLTEHVIQISCESNYTVMQIRDIAVKTILPDSYQSFFNLYIIIFKDNNLSDEYFLKLTDKIYDVYSNLKLDEKYYKE